MPKAPKPENAMYRGSIRHRRFKSTNHQFRYSTSMIFLELNDIERVMRPFPLFGSSKPALAWFRQADYHQKQEISLDRHIRNQVEISTGNRPTGSIYVLSQLRYWGFFMNPIALFYCYDQNGELENVVLQVTNTPWREKILYVLGAIPGEHKQRFVFPKEMHVSPFNPMDMHYQCRLTVPGNNLLVHIENHSQGEKHTDATLVLKKTPLTQTAMVRQLLLSPPETIKVFLGIYFNALKLWWKKTPFHTHPNHESDTHKLNSTTS